MKPDRFSELLQDIDKSLIVRAQKRRNNNKAVIIRMVAFAACLAIVVTGGIHAFVINGNLNTPDDEIDSIIGNEGVEFDPSGSNTGSIEGDAEGGTASDGAPSKPNVNAGGEQKPDVNSSAVKKLGIAVYPEQVQYPSADYFNDYDTYYEQYKAWHKANADKRAGYSCGNKELMKKFTEVLLVDDGKNKLYSPANIYFLISMLAKTTEGDSRQQILDVLDIKDVPTLELKCKELWNKYYSNDGQTTMVLANSLWLTNRQSYNQNTIDSLADNFYASVYSGDFTDKKYTQALRDWINEQTGGLLKESVDNVEFTPETVFSLMSTVYFKAPWQRKFSSLNNTTGVFHSPSGDRQVEFMNLKEDYDIVYYSDNYMATRLGLGDNFWMDIILPDLNYTVTDVLNNSTIVDYLLWQNENIGNKALKRNISMPKFDVSCETDLIDSLKKLGVTDIFEEDANFSALQKNSDVTITEATQSVRVRVDENGVEGSGMAVADGLEGFPPDDEVDFILDRPFIFVIRGLGDMPLFIGIVNNP